MGDSNVTIWSPELSAQDIRGRLLIADGSEKTVESNTVEDRYAPNSFVPKMPWRLPTENEITRLISRSNSSGAHQIIGVIRVDSSIVDCLREIFVSRATQKCSSEETDRALSEMLPRIRETLRQQNIWSLDNEAQSLIFGHNSPGKLTVSFDHQNGQFVGLHIDNFDGRTRCDLRQASNRMSVNIGLEPRSLLFLEKQAVKIWEEYDAWRGTEVTNERVITHYFRDLNGVQDSVWRLRIDPGEAYIAPTENVVHDGCSLDMTQVDIHFTVRGNFVPNLVG